MARSEGNSTGGRVVAIVHADRNEADSGRGSGGPVDRGRMESHHAGRDTPYDYALLQHIASRRNSRFRVNMTTLPDLCEYKPRTEERSSSKMRQKALF
jgi:hypothetical protein